MDYKEQLEESRALFLELLTEKGAKDIIELDESEEIFPISWKVQGVLDGRWINAIFTLVVGGEPCITFYHKNVNEKDLTCKDFIQVMASIEVSKPEYTLERFKLKPNEQLITTYEMCEDSNTMCTFYELKQKLN